MLLSLKCLPAVYLSLNSCFEGVHVSPARNIISIFRWHTWRGEGEKGVCTGLHAVIRTIALFSVTSLVILNEFCRLLFVLMVFINRLKSLTWESSGRLNDSLIYVFLFMGPCKHGGFPKRIPDTRTHLYMVRCPDHGCQQFSVTVSLDEKLCR